MKRINIILCAMALLLSASCDRKIDFPHETFVTFYDVTYSINEKVGTVEIPVTIYNPTGREVMVTVEAVDGEGAKGAKEGVNYEIASAGVISFTGEDETHNITVNLIHDSALTGTKNFSVRINSATDGISVGGYNVATVKILDNEHPLAPMIGEWSGTMAGATGSTYEMTFNVEAVDDDDTFTQLKLDSGIEPNFGKGTAVMYSAVSPDGKTIVVQSEQLIGYENYYLQGLTSSPEGFSLGENFKFVLNADGTLSLDPSTAYAVMAPGVDNGNDAPMEIYYDGIFVKK